VKGFDGGGKYRVKLARCEIGRKVLRLPIQLAPRPQWPQLWQMDAAKKAMREVAEPFAEEDARLNGVGRVRADGSCA